MPENEKAGTETPKYARKWYCYILMIASRNVIIILACKWKNIGIQKGQTKISTRKQYSWSMKISSLDSFQRSIFYFLSISFDVLLMNVKRNNTRHPFSRFSSPTCYIFAYLIHISVFHKFSCSSMNSKKQNPRPCMIYVASLIILC